MLGGDYRQVGFIRRNALQALWRIHVYDARVHQALIQALSDPYFEVRSFAARSVARLSDLIGPDPDLERCLRRNLNDRWFEVVVASLEPLGECSQDPGILSDLMPLLEHHNWKVQETTVRCMIRLMERGVVHLEGDEEARMKKIPMKGLDFSPRFQLQKTWESFLQIRSRGSAEARSSEPD
jgi:UDP-N-acetylglucosamine--N-acetylmuramyl-(pentapeptide) pyrophosphoryl-undecaprenol N-acetylglucosamine transferase